MLSVGEEAIHSFLSHHNISFQPQYGVSINKKWYRFDFAIFNDDNVKCLIEYHGAQHYDAEHLHWGKPIEVNQERDNIKKQWAKANNITLYEIPYWEFDDIDKILEKIIYDTE